MIKYSDLPRLESLIRLIQVSFSTPKKNLMMYRLYNAMKEHILYVENEKSKLLQKYGTDNGDGTYKLKGDNLKTYQKKWNELLDMEIAGSIPDADFTEDDFSEDNCSYPQDKTMWPSGADIITIVDFCDKLKKERKQ